MKIGSFASEAAQNSLGYLFWQATLAWQRQISQGLKKIDLTYVQYTLLTNISSLSWRSKEITQVQLAKYAQTDIMMTSKVLRTLEAKKLITREAHQRDTRAKNLKLTDLGTDVLIKAISIAEPIDSSFFASLPQELFRDSLTKLIKNKSNAEAVNNPLASKTLVKDTI